MSSNNELPLYIVDAFTSEPTRGNPAAVCIVDKFPPAKLMQDIAMEMNLSETAFVCAHEDGAKGHFRLKWFTPTNEVDLCGHATLATSHTLFAERKYTESEELRFETLSGELRVAKDTDGVAPNAYRMELPAGIPTKRSIDESKLSALCEALGLPDSSVVDAEHIEHCGRSKKLVLPLKEAANVLRCNADPARLLAVGFEDVRGVIVTSSPLNDANAPRPYASYASVSRYFTPWNGIPEDPVTGSAHAVLGVYWANRLNKKGERLQAAQVSARTGQIWMTYDEERAIVTLVGCARTTVRGQFLLPN